MLKSKAECGMKNAPSPKGERERNGAEGRKQKGKTTFLKRRGGKQEAVTTLKAVTPDYERRRGTLIRDFARLKGLRSRMVSLRREPVEIMSIGQRTSS